MKKGAGGGRQGEAQRKQEIDNSGGKDPGARKGPLGSASSWSF